MLKNIRGGGRIKMEKNEVRDSQKDTERFKRIEDFIEEGNKRYAEDAEIFGGVNLKSYLWIVVEQLEDKENQIKHMTKDAEKSKEIVLNLGDQVYELKAERDKLTETLQKRGNDLKESIEERLR